MAGSLANLERQTGLTFTRQREKATIWVVSEGTATQPAGPGTSQPAESQAAVTSTAPSESDLPYAIEDWVRLLEEDRCADAAKRWAKNAEVAQQMLRWWESLKKGHQRHDYRKWVQQAEQAPGTTAFKVGGHEYGFMHTDWEKTPEGWRIVTR
ncbi:MAG: hypothetical protein WC869_07600 [Phycisphaerae bacterium]